MANTENANANAIDISMVKFDEKGLVPAVVQEENGQVLMLAYMNEESLKKTLETGYTWFFSRSRQKLWQKGETSGNVQKVKEISYDCDGDTLLVRVHQTGVACHTGTYTCFSGRKLMGGEEKGIAVVPPEKKADLAEVLYDLYNVIQDRRLNPVEGSYTNYLFEKGQDKILKKVGEEAVETIIASKNNLESATNDANAAKAKTVIAAQAKAEAMAAEGKGIADQRVAIARGIKDSIDTIRESGVTEEEANRLFEFTQWTDMMNNYAASGKATTVLLPEDFDQSGVFKSIVAGKKAAEQ